MESDGLVKYGSRKFIALILTVILAVAVPIVYSFCNIGEAVTLAVLGVIATIAGVYTGFNVLSKGK